MIPELGLFALVLALVIAVLQSIAPLYGLQTRAPTLASSARFLSIGQLVFVAISFACLTTSFLQDDFSVKYVANHSNTLLPTAYKVSAVWGGHEGSLLLWALILAGWSAAVAVFSRQLPDEMLARVLAVMGMISVGFLLFILITSSPFERYLPRVPSEGSDLNPLLQDFGLIVHPPMLYMGYVGFSVAFAFAIAALLGGKLDAAWARWSRPWTTVAWAFLTAGIALGSWWAYYELGWGGWWFWDPVENASFMPWLVGTALIHSLAVTEKRGSFKSWTVLLAIMAFSLSLLGTFLVRSGVLTSVHAFASDPERGQFVLGLLAITLVCSLGLFAAKAPAMASQSSHSFFSKETFLLGNNILFVAALAVVMLGTLYPLILDFVGGGKISIGPPYFNTWFVPLMSVLAILFGFGFLANWKSQDMNFLVKRLVPVLMASVGASVLAPLFLAGEFSWGAVLGVFLAVWVSSVCFVDLLAKTRNARSFGEGVKKLRASYWGMQLGHLGFAACILGVALVSTHSEERDVRLAPGDSYSLGEYNFTYVELKHVRGPNYESEKMEFSVSVNGSPLAPMFAEKRHYFSQRSNPMTEAAIDAGLFRDVYIALGEPLGNDAWAVRLQVKPFVRWIWLGAALMAIGGIIAIADKRYRAVARNRRPVQTGGAQTAS